VEQSVHMETVQIVLDKSLLKAADRAARLTRQNRSSLVRKALREHLRKLEIAALEERDREGYRNHPQNIDEALEWERVAAWPNE
jgi:metal-responsive CopG/Arc/MetJ family transcriptional regulator